MPAKIRKNPEQTAVEITTPEGEVYLDDMEDPVLFCCEDQRKFIAVVGENDYGLKPDAVYELVPVETLVEPDAELEVESDE